MTDTNDSDLPNQQSMFSDPDEPETLDPEPAEQRPLSQRNERALERLRDRINLAAKELRRLRSENADLHSQLEDLQTHGLGSVEGTPIVFTENASALRTKVEGFIETIDDYLASRNDLESVESDGGTEA